MHPTQSIGRLSSCITTLSHLYLTTHLHHYGISSGQLHLLMRLYREDGIHQETLAKDLLIDKTTCTRAIKKLIDAGFITQQQDPNDKRANHLFLTIKAKTLEKEIRHILKQWRDILLTDFTIEEQHQFLIYLQRAIDNAHNHLNKNDDLEKKKL